MARSRRRALSERRAGELGRKPITVLLLGRTTKNKGGGIARSARLIVEALKSVGDVCRLRNVNEPLIDIPSDTELIWHYGDIDYIEQQLVAAREARVPILINSTYDDTADRRRYLHDRIAAWDPAAKGDVLLAVFTHSAAADVRNHRIARRMVAVPKTIMQVDSKVIGFAEREGICIGDVEKLKRTRLVRGMNVATVVEVLQRACPGAKIYAYNQYGPAAASLGPGVTVVSPSRQDGFIGWLGARRLYVSVVRHETFAMVGPEAQAAGTVVLYRHMPQSLTEHLGPTGLVFEDLEELRMIAQRMYYDEQSWTLMSESGRHNAAARGSRVVGAAIGVALRKALLRARMGG